MTHFLLGLLLLLLASPSWAYEELAKKGDTASAEADAGVPIICVRQDTLATSTTGDAHYAHVKCNTLGSMYADTELSAAAQITADAQTAPTAGGVYSYMMCLNGTGPTWNRCANAPQDVDDGSIAFAQNGVLSLGLNQYSNGTNWIRLFGTAANGPTWDQANTAETDYDTGAGTVLQTMMGIALPASGGPVAGGTTTNPVVVAFPSSQNVTCSNCSGTGVSVLEDATAADAAAGTPAYAVRQDTIANSVTADGGYGWLKLNNIGRLYTTSTIDAALPAGSNIIGAVTGTVAHAAADSGNPQKIGAVATNDLTANTNVTTTQRTNLFAGLDGVLLVREHADLEDRVNGIVSLTTTTSTQVIAAQGAGVRFCATTLVVSNSGTVNSTVDFRDGTAGSVLLTVPAAANMGGAVVPLAVPLCGTANTIFAAQPSVASTTVAITAIGFKTKL
jgi:hypothetical protein